MPSCGGTSKLNAGWRWEDQEQAVLSTCSSLIAVVNEDGGQVVQFSHFSVKEFLISSRLASSSPDVSRYHIDLEPAHTVLAKVCLGVLLRLDSHADKDSVEEGFPLARYAAEYWVTHARFEGVSPHIQEAMEDLFDPEKPYFLAWIRIYDVDAPLWTLASGWHYFAIDDNLRAPPLYYAALLGFHDLVERLIVNYPQHVNAKGGCFASPLAAALSRQNFKIAQLLYEHGADLDVRGEFERTLLYAVSSTGIIEVTQWLLDRGADPNARIREGGACDWTPLLSTAYEGQFECSRILLQHRRDNNTRNSWCQILSHLASSEEHMNETRLVVEQEAGINVRDWNGYTPLHLASERGHLEVVRLLVEHGADIDAENNDGKTAYQVAANEAWLLEVTRDALEERRDKITSFLSKRGAK
jgi:hypothetical protein